MSKTRFSLTGELLSARNRRAAEWHREPSCLLDEAVMRALARGAGSPRTFLRRELVDDRTWSREPLSALVLSRSGAGTGPARAGPAVLLAARGQTLRHLLTGRSEKAIAWEMGISTTTLHQYVRSVYGKLGVRSRAEAMSRFCG